MVPNCYEDREAENTTTKGVGTVAVSAATLSTK